jgi:DNA-binding transcriptional regulator GbsR (MarR family)
MRHITSRQEYIEECGLIMEKAGLTRMVGRIIGYLAVSDKETVSFEEFTEVLQASKSSISTSVKMLTTMNLIKPATIPGDRKTYYRLAPDYCWSQIMRLKTGILSTMHAMFMKGLEFRIRKADNTTKWLTEAAEFYKFMENEIPALLDKWEERKPK